MARVILCLGLLVASAAHAAVGLESGRVAGRVLGPDGLPVAGAIAIVRWGGWFPEGRGEVCVKSIAVKTDAAGRFAIPEWKAEAIFGDSASFVASAYAPGFVRVGSIPLNGAKRLTRFHEIRIPASEIRISMAPFTGDDRARLKALLGLVAETDCRTGGMGSTEAARDFYLAIRAEIATMPPEIGNYRENPSRYTALEIVDKQYLEPSGVDTRGLRQVPVIAAPAPHARIEAVTPRPPPPAAPSADESQPRNARTGVPVR